MKIVVNEQKKKKVRDIRDLLRDQLAGFARSGSQVPAIQHLEQDEEDAEGVGGDGSDEEVDQLDASDGIIQEEAQVTAQIPDKPQALFDESRQSSPEAETETQRTGGHSSTSAIDLTIDVDDDMFDDSQLGAPIFDPAKHTPSSTLIQEVIVTRPEVIRTAGSHTGDVSLRFDLSKISTGWQHLRDRLTAASATSSSAATADDAPASVPRVPLDAGVSNTENGDRAVDALARVIEKQDFATMDVVGQFNLGFIVARRRKPITIADGQIDLAEAAMDDLFIVDQHAADEKYNFETLQQTTSIKSQKLFRWVFFHFREMGI
jgi:DNA mismatch repair protein PMS2